MILYGSQRGRSAELAVHLLNGDQNEHVAVHEIRGFAADDLAGALEEAFAVSKGTRCSQFLFSLSLNPPETEEVPVEDFESALHEIERKLGLTDQPRVIVFHEKNGRRHCHAVWSRIQSVGGRLCAINMDFFKRKLTELSRQLFLEHHWELPKGLQKGQDKEKNPQNMTREEYRQAVRLVEDPQALKAMFKQAWEQSDSRATFARALEENGFFLARGDRRGYVAVDVKGGIYSLTRWLDLGTRDLKARIGATETLPSSDQAKSFLSARLTENLNRFISALKTKAAERRAPLVQEIRAMTADHRAARRELLDMQQKRWGQETRQRSKRLARGVRGIWERISGEYQKIRKVNEAETKACLERDRRELQDLIRRQLQERQELQKAVTFYRDEHRQEVYRLRREMALYISTAAEPPPPPKSAAPPLAAQLAVIEARLSVLSGDITMLQASLESNLISDEMRARIRLLIERAVTALQLKALETVMAQKKEEERAKELAQKVAELNDLLKRQVELQQKMEEQRRQIEANRQIFALIRDMSYALNGLPPWKIPVMAPPPDKRLDESAFLQTVQRRDNMALASSILNSPANESQVSRRPPINPPTAVPALRANILEAKELLARAGLRPPGGGGTSAVLPTLPRNAAIKFNRVRR